MWIQIFILKNIEVLFHRVMNKRKILVLVALIALSVPALPVMGRFMNYTWTVLMDAASACDIDEIPGRYRLVARGMDQRLHLAKDGKGSYLVDGVSIPFDWEYLSDCNNIGMDFGEEYGFRASLAWEAIPQGKYPHTIRNDRGLYVGVVASCFRSPRKLFVYVDSNIHFEELTFPL